MKSEEVGFLEAHAARAARVTLCRLPAVVEPAEMHHHVVSVRERLAALGTGMQHGHVAGIVSARVLAHPRLAAVRLVAARAAHFRRQRILVWPVTPAATTAADGRGATPLRIIPARILALDGGLTDGPHCREVGGVQLGVGPRSSSHGCRQGPTAATTADAGEQ